MARIPEQGIDPMEDRLIVLRCQLGERAAFDELIKRWATPVAGYARRVTQSHDAAADLTQEIWLRIFRGIDRLREPERFRSWLFGIAHRAFVDTLRQRTAAPESLAENVEAIAVQSINNPEDIELIEFGMTRLPAVEREILSLFYLQELSLEEIAHALGIPTGTVKSRLHRARQLLRMEFNKVGESR